MPPSAVARVRPTLTSQWLTFLLLLTLAVGTLGTAWSQTAGTSPAVETGVGGPIRLQQAATPTANASRSGNANAAPDEAGTGNTTNTAPRQPGAAPVATPPPETPRGEFEQYVQQLAGPSVQIHRFGSELVSGGLDGRNAEFSPLVPPEYVISPGDELLVNLWGSVDADLRLQVDRNGRITLPRVGPIQVSGVPYGELQSVISARVATVFRNFQISVTVGQLRGVRVFVSGFVHKPGTYTVSGLSTVVGVLMRAGGPAASGSFRNIELRRGGELVASFDLYELLLRGNRSADRIVQAGDVVHVGPVGIQVGFIGSVNMPTVLELKAGETVGDALRIAGGLTAVADRSRLAVERLSERSTARVTQLALPADLSQTLSHGDVVRAFSSVDAALPTQLRSKRVKVEGEVGRPAEYVLPVNSSIGDAIRAAGGFTQNAFIYATEFNRESVRKTQQESYERALRDMETDFTRMSASYRSSGTEALGDAARVQSLSRLIERLRLLRPNGRIVLQLQPDSQNLPDMALEDGDRIYVPPRPTTVGVFGSVFNPSSYVFQSGRTLGDYLRLAGGPTRSADAGSTFVIRANGSVSSQRQASGWFVKSHNVDTLPAEPGDTLFVPEEVDRTTFVQAAKDWTQILYQLGIGLAGIKSAVQ